MSRLTSLALPFCLVLLTTALTAPTVSAGEPLPAPEGRAILTVEGEIGVSNRNGAAVFDREMLRAVGWRQVDTYTPFGESRESFAGVPLAALLERLRAEGVEIEARALNDYAVTIPVEHAERHDVLLALERNGEVMSVRQRGPIWIIYPSDVPVHDEERYHASLMVWQLHKLTVR